MVSTEIFVAAEYQGFVLNANQCGLNLGVIVLTASYGAETWGIK